MIQFNKNALGLAPASQTVPLEPGGWLAAPAHLLASTRRVLVCLQGLAWAGRLLNEPPNTHTLALRCLPCSAAGRNQQHACAHDACAAPAGARAG